MTVDHYIAAVDSAILVLLLAWAWMDRHNIYFKEK